MTSPSDAVAADPDAVQWRRRRVFGFTFFITLVTSLFALLHAYVGARLFATLPPAATSRAWAVLWTLFIFLPMGPILGRVAPRWLGTPLKMVAYLWMGSFGLLLSATVITDLVRVALKVTHVSMDGSWQPWVIALSAFPAAVFGLIATRGVPSVRRSRFTMPGLGADLSGLRIVQLSDVHVGETFLDGRWLRGVVDRVNSLAPDVVVITGDLIDGPVSALREHVAPLADLKAPLGVYFITGNHEYYSGANAWIEVVRSLGIRVLINEHSVLRRGNASVVLGGIPDPTGAQFGAAHQPDVARAFAGSDPQSPRILLAHQPRSAPFAASANVTLQLSGHTHGGQIFPFMFFVRLQQPVVAGWHRVAGVWVYTHRGTGYWGPPMRVGSPAEIAEITLLDGPQAGPA